MEKNIKSEEVIESAEDFVTNQNGNLAIKIVSAVAGIAVAAGVVVGAKKLYDRFGKKSEDDIIDIAPVEKKDEEK